MPKNEKEELSYSEWCIITTWRHYIFDTVSCNQTIIAEVKQIISS